MFPSQQKKMAFFPSVQIFWATKADTIVKDSVALVASSNCADG
jgi:hypothetical protein